MAESIAHILEILRRPEITLTKLQQFKFLIDNALLAPPPGINIANDVRAVDPVLEELVVMSVRASTAPLDAYFALKIAVDEVMEEKEDSASSAE